MGRYASLEALAQKDFNRIREICSFRYRNEIRLLDPALYFTNHINKLGICNKHDETSEYLYSISVSRPYLPAREFTRNTIVHEFAHVISEDPGHGSDFFSCLAELNDLLDAYSEPKGELYIAREMQDVRDFNWKDYVKICCSFGVLIEELTKKNNAYQILFDGVLEKSKELFPSFDFSRIYPRLLFTLTVSNWSYLGFHGRGDYDYYIYLSQKDIIMKKRPLIAITFELSRIVSGDYNCGEKFREIVKIYERAYKINILREKRLLSACNKPMSNDLQECSDKEMFKRAAELTKTYAAFLHGNIDM